MPRRRIPRSRIPKIPKSPQRELVRLYGKLFDEALNLSRPMIERLVNELIVDATLAPELQREIEGIRLILASTFNPRNTSPALLRILRKVSDRNRRDLARVLSIDIREDLGLARLLDSFMRDNVALIGNATQELQGRIGALIDANRGVRASDIAQQIEEVFQIGKRKAALIARDQVLKANGELTKIRQQDAGISEYIWITSQDERVRDSHAALHGTRQSWYSPPDVGHPGEDIQCRCTASPVIPGVE